MSSFVNVLSNQSPSPAPIPAAPDIGADPNLSNPPASLGAPTPPPQAPAAPAQAASPQAGWRDILGGMLDVIVNPAKSIVNSERAQEQRLIANRQANDQAVQARGVFASAQAATEVARAHQADLQLQAQPQELQDQATARALEIVDRAKGAGYNVVASVPLDQGEQQNTVAAMTALKQTAANYGGKVPQGMLYQHIGDSMIVLKLNDPAAALETVNQGQRAEGLPVFTQDQFMALPEAQRTNLAKDAMTLTDPRDIQGQVSQTSLNIARYRLATAKAQPAFNGQDELVARLQSTVDHQKAVVDQAATESATRTGAAQGAQAVAAQPGQTAAQVANINATAGPEARAAAQKASAILQANPKPVYGVVTDANGEEHTQMMTMGEAEQVGASAIRPVTQTDISKDQHDVKVLNDIQLRSDVVKRTASALDAKSLTNVAAISTYLTKNPDTTTSALVRSSMLSNATPKAQAYIVAVNGLRETAMGLQRVLTGTARTNEAQLNALLATVPGYEPNSKIALQKLQAFDQNLTMLAQGLPENTGVKILVRRAGQQWQPASGAGVAVTDPRGGIHTFKDQASADNFKKAAGIQ